MELAVARDGSPLGYELIDLAEIALPFLDEPLMAALGRTSTNIRIG